MSDSERRPGSSSATPARRQRLRSIVLLVVTAVALYLLLPGLVAVFSSWRTLLHLDLPFAAGVLLFEGASSFCLWVVDRIALGSVDLFTIACAQLAGNALGRVVPGSATPFSVVILKQAGVDGGQAAAALTASTLLQISTALALPVLAVPAMLGGAPIDRGLKEAAYLGIGVVLVLIGIGVLFLTTDGALKAVGRTIQWVLNATIRRRHRLTDLPRELLENRDFVRQTLGRRWRHALLAAAGNTGFDYLALLCALRAVGASPRPSLVVLAYASAELLAQIPFTPGGLGFVEAGLVGTLTLAGVPGHAALAATLLYRLVSYWIPIPAGGAAYLLLRRRLGTVRAPTTSEDRER